MVTAPDLETLGTAIHQRLGRYCADGAPQSERRLVERVNYEHQVRRYLTRCHERGFAFSQQFDGFASLWVDFVNQNKAAESENAHLSVRRAYEAGRRDAGEALNEGWAPAPSPAAPVRSAAFDPIAIIDRLVHDAVAQRVANLVPNGVPALAPITVPPG